MSIPVAARGVGEMVEPAERPRFSRMFSAKETDQRIRELAEAEGSRQAVVVRFVDPSTLPASKIKIEDREPSKVAGMTWGRLRDTATKRQSEGRSRGLIIGHLDSLDGGSCSYGELRDATGVGRSTLSYLLVSLVAHGIIERSGERSHYRYRRP
jgi:DNA-binding transcriptional ArsR family regulator